MGCTCDTVLGGGLAKQGPSFVGASACAGVSTWVGSLPRRLNRGAVRALAQRQKRVAQQASGSRSTKGLRTTAYHPAPPLSLEVTAANKAIAAAIAAAPTQPAGRKRTSDEACPSPHAVHTRARLRGARVGSTRDLTGMAFRQALQLAACGLGVVLTKEYRDARSGRFQREPLSLVNLRKRNLETGEEELTSRLDHCKAKATRHIFLIRHSQYHVDASLEKDRTLTPLGREQAELTGLRLASLGLKFNKIVHSSMTRAVETTDIISKHLPGVCKVSTDLLREGAPIEPDPPVSHWKPEAVQYYEDGARIEAAFRNYIHRADAKQQEDSYEIFICHANVIRYIVCRALQFPPEGWLRLSLNNGSITHLVVRPDGRVALRALGDTGFMPPDKISRS
nr:PREDICTED: serine/threonine-protein phosphatase PGAM5, mitochondrial [Bos mutus]